MCLLCVWFVCGSICLCGVFEFVVFFCVGVLDWVVCFVYRLCVVYVFVWCVFVFVRFVGFVFCCVL